MTKLNNKNMISRELFIKTIDGIERQFERDNDFSEALSKAFLNYPSKYDYSGVLISLENILIEEFEDKEGWISYFIYELNFGKDWTENSIEDNGKSVKMTNAGELYDYLLVNMEKGIKLPKFSNIINKNKNHDEKFNQFYKIDPDIYELLKFKTLIPVDFPIFEYNDKVMGFTDIASRTYDDGKFEYLTVNDIELFLKKGYTVFIYKTDLKSTGSKYKTIVLNEKN